MNFFKIFGIRTKIWLKIIKKLRGEKFTKKLKSLNSINDKCQSYFEGQILMKLHLVFIFQA